MDRRGVKAGWQALAFGVALFCLASPVRGAARKPAPQEPVAYTLSPVIRDGKLEALSVEIRFRADPSGWTGLDLPDHWAGKTELWRNLRDLSVERGRLVEKTDKPDPAHRTIHSLPREHLIVRYRVISPLDHDPTADDGQPFQPWIRPSWFYAMGEAVFAAPHGRQDAPATFDWSGAPMGFAFASDLQHLASRDHPALRPGVVGDVWESVMLGGTDMKVVVVGPQATPVRVAMRGKYSFTNAQFADLAGKVIADERDFWGGDRSPFLVTLAPVVMPLGGQSLGGTGRTDAFEMAISPTSPLSSQRWVLAHEYFHSWNPRQLGLMEDGPNQRLGYWLSEGFTDFYARRLLVRYGLYSPAEFMADWNEMLSAYAASPVRTVPNNRVLADFWTNYPVEKLPYQRGALLAAIWDARLRAASGGRTSLDDVLKAQRNQARGKAIKGGAPALFPVVAARFGLDVKPDIERHVVRGEPIILPADVFGPCVRVDTITRPVFDRGYDVDATAKAGNAVTGLRKDTPAYAAGLRDGMQLLERIKGEPDNSSVEYVIRVRDGAQERTLHFLPHGKGSLTLQQLVLTGKSDAATCARSLGGLPATSPAAPPVKAAQP